MGAFRDRLRGFFNMGAGRVKQGYSNDTGDSSMRSSGATQELKGKGQKTMGDVKQAAGDAMDRMGNKIRRTGS